MRRQVSGETIRATLARLLGVRSGNERNAGYHLSRSPIRKKKRRRDRLMNVAEADPRWAVGFEDECWWSRLALPTFSSWAEKGKPLRLIQQWVAKDDPDPKAISCYMGCTCRSSIGRG